MTSPTTQRLFEVARHVIQPGWYPVDWVAGPLEVVEFSKHYRQEVNNVLVAEGVGVCGNVGVIDACVGVNDYRVGYSSGGSRAKRPRMSSILAVSFCCAWSMVDGME